MFWESERLLYRHIIMSDSEALFRIYGDLRTQIFNPAGPHIDIEQSRKSIENRIIKTNIYGFNDWAIMKKEKPDHIIGFGGLFVSVFNGKLVNNLGYIFEPDAWGKGYATELSKRAISYGFEEIKLQEIVGVTRENNLASKRVLEKVGMKFIQKIVNDENLPAELMFNLSYDEWLAYGTN
ncbi:GNAT family N-acetyltransferase [Salmonella enterica subsp. enterica serovar Newport]|uniref:N-acetyltransferase n=1 Tax=Salmonella newport TaxID=108619 RepID=A0A5U9KH93_SALNE|nr:N-acetyltransferase [Salmonella enterica subsp. enterica serovar Newport]EDX0052040.1 GNAT family N-acetyltransferase [Salmonella enterica]ECN8538449.1 GNAT family N-acetyltransferase [Salmonella enterica subsp. enterica serovar Newport]EGF7279320.1 GNAT family N-acetyltransferase [Salmonella enterica]EJH8881659.1 GNAT family N-acetyltransferase [Salmonella enterica]